GRGRRLGRNGRCGRGRTRGRGGRGGRSRRLGFLLLEDAAENLAENAHSSAPDRVKPFQRTRTACGSVKLARPLGAPATAHINGAAQNAKRAQAVDHRVIDDSALKIRKVETATRR